MRGNVIPIEVELKRGKVAKSIPLYQYDYGQKLVFAGLELPSAYEVHFSNELHGRSITMIGDETGVEIPNQLLSTGLPVYLWLFLHDGMTDGETEYAGVIPVIARAEPSDGEPTPAQQSAIETAIVMLNAALESSDASDSEAWAIGKRGTEDVSSDDETYHNNSKYYAGQAESSATSAGTDAASAETDALKAEGYAVGKQNGEDVTSGSTYYQNNAKFYATQASDSATSASGSASAADDSAEDAEAYAVGKRDGVDVTSDDPAYHNNSKYYATEAAASALEATTAAASASAAYGTALLAPNYSSSSTYAVGDHVIYSGNYYECNTAISTAEAWTAAHWTQLTVGGETSALKSAFNSVTKKMTPVYSENVWNPSEEKAGYFVGTNGSEGTGDSYTCYSEPIPVEPGDVVRFYRLDGSAFAAENVRFICAYDENGDAVSASGVNGDTNSYTVPSGIYFINPTHYSRWTKRMMTINYEATVFIDYVEPYYIAGEGFHELIENAVAGDINKVLTAKTVNNGHVTEWELTTPATSVTIDATLTQTGQAADAKATGDALATKVNTGLMQYCDVATVPGSKNLWNPATTESGFIGTNGVISSSTSYCYNYIEVTPGDVVYASVAGTALNMRFICAYNENDEAVSASGSGSYTNGFTVPSGIVKLAITIGSAQKDTGMVILNDSNVPSAYIPYAPPTQAYVAKQEFLQNVNAMTEESFKSEYMEDVPKNILNPEDAVTKKLIIYNSGALTDNNDYYTTGYMPVVAGKTYYFWSNKLERKGGRAIAGFNSSKMNVGTAGINDGTASIYSYTVPAGIAFIRVSFAYRADDATFTPAGNMAIATAVPMEFMAYDGTEDYVFKSEIIPYDTPNLHVYLPPEICVGIGRTIELYNELVCLEADKYHLHYICAKGVQYGRKWSLTGATAGSYPLTLQIYDDNMKMVWTGTTTVKVVANGISSQLKVLPIGDSLTNLKAWIGEVQTLSNDKILYIGTRGRNDLSIRCEGRSGFTAADYNADTEYTFDSNYQGNPEVSGSVNPFWDGSKFSLSYYNTQQAATVGTADAVQLFLGTNDVFGGFTAEESAQHIKDLVDAIRDEFASIPIFVCNTIYRSNQSGYYSSGGQGFSAASGWAFDSDMKIMDFQNALTDALKSYTNLYIVPLSVCMDREYDFGVNEVDVNPRLSTVKEIIPTESVHPQDPGYYQMADVMYSSYIAHLS